MGRKCAYPECKSTEGLHSLPSNREVAHRWLRALGRVDIPSASVYVCNLHFTRECFSNYAEVEMGFKKQLLLNPEAIPNPAKVVTQVAICTSKVTRTETKRRRLTFKMETSRCSVDRRTCSVPGCKRENDSALFSVPTSAELKKQWLKFIFNDNVPIATNSYLFVCPKHFEADCFINAGQVKAGYASKLKLKEGTVPTVRYPGVKSEPGTDVSTRQFLPSVKHVACQTDPPVIKSVGTQLTMKYPFRSKATQARVSSRDCGVGTLTFPLDSPLLFLQPTIVKRPSKRPRLSLTDNEEEEEGPSQCTLSVTVHEPEDST